MLSGIIFGILWLVAFAPLALFMKVRRRRFLPVFHGDEPTFFLPKEKMEPTIEAMKRQW